MGTVTGSILPPIIKKIAGAPLYEQAPDLSWGFRVEMLLEKTDGIVNSLGNFREHELLSYEIQCSTGHLPAVLYEKATDPSHIDAKKRFNCGCN
jgi:hypothetical protein